MQARADGNATADPYLATRRCHEDRASSVNLLNTAKFTDEGGHIWLTADQEDDFALLRKSYGG